MLKLPFFKYLRNEMNRKPEWSEAHKKADEDDYKGKKIKFKKSDIKKIKRIKRPDSWVFSIWGVLFVALPMIIGGPLIGFSFLLILLFKAAWDFSRYQKEFEVDGK